jgi:SAM-dependent methyltransferase
MASDDKGLQQGYVPGDAPRELARLEYQAIFFRDMTRDVLLRAGIEPGMRILDLGCGVGDVSLIASELVGPSGKILAIDQSSDAIAVAQRRMLAAERHHVGFRQSSIEDFDKLDEFDAVIGRFILVHLPDPASALKRIAECVRKEAIIAFCELDLRTSTTTTESPLFDRSVKWIVDVFNATGRKADMGSELFAAFRTAGLAPKLAAYQRVGSQDEIEGLDFLAESVRTLVPAIEKLGIAAATDIDIETLKDRLVAEAQKTDPCIFFPRFVGAWART